MSQIVLGDHCGLRITARNFPARCLQFSRLECGQKNSRILSSRIWHLDLPNRLPGPIVGRESGARMSITELLQISDKGRSRENQEQDYLRDSQDRQAAGLCSKSTEDSDLAISVPSKLAALSGSLPKDTSSLRMRVFDLQERGSFECRGKRIAGVPM